MSRLKGMRGARKLKAFKKERISVCSSEEDWEASLARAGDRLLVAEFSAAWSLPCKAMAPYVAALSQQPEFKAVDFVRVDLDACPALGAKLGVLSAPTYQLRRGGLLLDSLQGAVPQRLIEMLALHKGPSAQSGKLSLKLVLLAGVLATTVALMSRRRATSGSAATKPGEAGTSVQQQEEPPGADSSHDGGANREAARVAPPQKTGLS